MRQGSQFRTQLKQPPIALRRGDQRALLDIAYGGLLANTRSAAALLDEVSRAELLPDDAPSTTIALWSRVLFRGEGMGPSGWITVVPPDISTDPTTEVSVLSPLGAALIGLSKGQHIQHPDRHGGEVRLKILDIAPAEQDHGGPI